MTLIIWWKWKVYTDSLVSVGDCIYLGDYKKCMRWKNFLMAASWSWLALQACELANKNVTIKSKGDVAHVRSSVVSILTEWRYISTVSSTEGYEFNMTIVTADQSYFIDEFGYIVEKDVIISGSISEDTRIILEHLYLSGKLSAEDIFSITSSIMPWVIWWYLYENSLHELSPIKNPIPRIDVSYSRQPKRSKEKGKWTAHGMKAGWAVSGIS